MATRRFCDRCNQEITYDLDCTIAISKDKRLARGYDDPKGFERKLDLCLDCMDIVVKAINKALEWRA